MKTGLGVLIGLALDVFLAPVVGLWGFAAILAALVVIWAALDAVLGQARQS